MSAKRKRSAVLRLLRGEDLELVSRELAVPAAELSAWRDAFLAAGEARLRFAGIRTAKRRVLRLMREHGLLAPSRVVRPHGPRAHDGIIRTERVDEMWGTDLTSTLTSEGQASIFVAVDHASTECLGIHAARRGRRSATTSVVVAGSQAPASRRSSRCAKVRASPSAASPGASRAA